MRQNLYFNFGDARFESHPKCIFLAMPRIESSYPEKNTPAGALAEIERDSKAGAIKTSADHVWAQDLCTNVDISNPSIFWLREFFVVLSRMKTGDILLEVASLHGAEGGRLQVSEEKAGATYAQLVAIGDADDNEPPMMRVCRDAAGRLALAFGKSTPAPHAERVFTKLKYVFALEPSSPRELCRTLSQFMGQVAARRRDSA